MPSDDGRDDVGEDSGAVGGGVSEEVARETPGAVVKQPKPLRLGQPRMDVVWKRFEKAYDFYARATKLVKKDPEIQAAAFMSILGDEVDEIYENFNLTEREASDVDVIKRKFRNYFAPKENEVYESYVLRQMQQDADESVDQFVTRVAAQARNCNYPSIMIDRMTRDQIVIGVNNLDAREKLLEIENLTLDRAIKICKAHEKASKQTRLIAEDIKAVSVVKKRVQSDKKSKKEVPSETSRDLIECKKCGRQHVPGICLSSGKVCYKCNEKGHFARVCKQKRKKVKNIEKKSSESDEDDSDTDGSEEIQKVWALSESKNSDQWKVTLECQGQRFQAKIDTGAECNVISRRILRGMDNLIIMPSRVKKLVAYNGGVIEVLGKVKLPCEIKGRKHEFWFQVIKGPKKTILDGKSAIQAGLLARIDDLKACQDLFRGLGCVKGFEYDIDLVEHPQFKVHAARQIPHSMREDVKRELDKMVKQKVIERCEEAADCVSPLVVVKRNGKIRLCIDLTDLNVNVKRRHFPLRGIEEISSRIEGSKKFTLLDCTKGFWQIKVTPRTSRILTFATPWGRYSCLRMPFGLASAPEIYQSLMVKILGDIPKVEVSMDDILIHGADSQELMKTTQAVVSKLRECGLKLNKDKCVFDTNSVRFLGHVVTKDGLKIDPEKVESIERLKAPHDKKSLLRFLGMVTYVGKFIPNLSQVTAPLRELVKNGMDWAWETHQQKAFEEVKRCMMQAPTLKFFDVNKDVTLSVDSSSKAFGAALMQDGRPIAYASKALTESEQNWPQIEKEAGAIRFAVRKFHDYVWGKKLTVESDHKPLEAIFRKPMTLAPPRLKRIMYDVKPYAPIVIYKKGTEIPLADTLSRDCEPIGDEDDDFPEHLEINTVLCMGAEAESKLVQATQEDEVLQKLKKVIKDGWPNSPKEVPGCLRAFFTFREELAYVKDVIFKGDQCVIPESVRKSFLKLFHHGHCGIQATLRRARDAVFWPGMTKDITEMIESCQVCQQTQRKPQKETVLMKPVPELPFQLVAMDLFAFKGRDYIILADSFSGYFDFKKLSSTTSRAIIDFCKEKFAEHGIPQEVHSDGGPQFTSREFRQFSRDWGFARVLSSPYFARSNGFVERYVQTAKKILKRCEMDGHDVKMALLMERNTRREGLDSPSERLFGRKTRNPTTLTDDSLKPCWISDEAQKLSEARMKQKKYADRGAVDHKPLQPGEKVRVLDGDIWVSGTVKAPETERSYQVHLDDGRLVRRNSSFLKPTKVTTPMIGKKSSITVDYDSEPDTIASDPLHNTVEPETEVNTPNVTNSPKSERTDGSLPVRIGEVDGERIVTTRSGRVVKKPNRLNL